MEAQVCSYCMVIIFIDLPPKKTHRFLSRYVGRYIRTCYGFGFSAPELGERPKNFELVFFCVVVYVVVLQAK